MNYPDNEWSLIIFNIIGDLSVGAFIALGLAHLYAARKHSAQHADLLSTRALLVIGPLLLLGMLAVFGHVGNPERVFNMLSNLDTSWLAREVAAYGAFLVFGGAFAILQALTLLSPERQQQINQTTGGFLPKLRILLAWIAALIGIFFVLSAAMIYYDPRLASRQTGWAHIYTPILFFVDTGLLGSLMLGVGFVANYLWLRGRKHIEPASLAIQESLLRDVIKGISFASIALVGVLFVAIPIYLVYLAANPNPLNAQILRMLHTDFAVHWFLRLFLAFTGAGVLAVFIAYLSERSQRQRLLYLLVVLAFACVLAGEVIGRYLFYARNAMLMIGGV
ncbi:MAG: dimethyl sulfoxide reductase anchor subunit [Chloroflexi bacterium]|uniref:dimethyl sulfoxide reductase anchor subunit family protein n=1 Tax=Candidatus Flexifilum breve TaxID=3140694 RepID=UPI0031365CDF|nr:dimethyl sulfoxide reductase anchor subunit [Chloroflexota bacterium]